MAPSPDQRDSAPKLPNSEIVELIPALRGYARPFYREANDADDLVKETLMTGLAPLHQFQAGTSLKSWLFTIMRNTFYPKVKIAKREAPGSADCVSAKPVV